MMNTTDFSLYSRLRLRHNAVVFGDQDLIENQPRFLKEKSTGDRLEDDDCLLLWQH